MINITSENLQRFDAVIGRVMEAGKAAGLAAAVVNKQGEIVFEKFYGLRDAEKNLPIDGDTIFGLASLSKSFTSLAIMQLHEAGKLNINDPVSKYVPEFGGGNRTEPVLIHHLMSHSGGYYPQKRILMEDVAKEMGYTQEKDGDFSFNDAIEARGTHLVVDRLNKQTDFIDQPGRAMSYFNDGFAVLTNIIMHVSGERSFADYIKNHICQPLGMDRSSSEFVAPAADPNAAVVYITKTGERTISNNLDNAFVLNGGGGMKSTLHDMARYVSMYLNFGKGTNGNRVASTGSIREMIKPHQTDGYNSYYGFGLMQTPCDTYTLVRHGGSLPGVSSHMAWSYETGLGVVILCNTADVTVAPLAESLMRLAISRDPEICLPTYTEQTWSPELLASACGDYASDEGAGFSIAAENGKPVVVVNGVASPLIVLSDRYMVKRGPFADVNFEVLIDETRGVYAMRQGARIVRKVK